MKAIDDNKDIIEAVAKEFNLDPKYVTKVVKFYYRSIGKFIESLSLENPEGFREINLPSLFTLVPTYKRALKQVKNHNFNRTMAKRPLIDMETFKERALKDIDSIKEELREKRKISQSRDNRYNNHRNKINEKRNNENIHNGASDTSNSTRDADDKGV